MNLIYIAALVAVCSAAKLDRTYLPPASSKGAGGSSDLLVPHFRDYFEPGRSGLPKGAEENEFDGVVVEAAAPGTRAKGSGESGLGGSRVSYGSTYSKVGEAAFRIKEQQRPVGNIAGPGGQSDYQTSQNYQPGTSYGNNRPRPSAGQSDSQASPNFPQNAPSDFDRPRPAVDKSDSPVSHSFHQGTPPDFRRPRPGADQSYTQGPQNFQQGQPGSSSDFNRFRPTAHQSGPQTLHSFHIGTPSNFIGERPQSAMERKSNTVRIENNVGPKAYNYAYETENGITAEERGVSINGVRAEGGFSYTGDDGKLYKITYTAGEGGYQPVGDHLPTPPPIPDEILKSLEQNAKEDAEGSDDDGSYDAAKYNAEDDYTKSDSSNGQQPAKKPDSDVNKSGTFINQNNGPFESFSNNNRQEPTYINRFSEPHSIEDNFTTTLKGSEPNDGIPIPNPEQQNYDSTKFVPSQHAQKGDDATITQFGSINSEKLFNKQSDVVGSDDFSRPIKLGSTQFSQVPANSFSNMQPNLPTSNYFTHNQVAGVNSDTIQEGVSPQQEPQGIPSSSNFDEMNINQQKVNSQGNSQIASHNNKHMNNNNDFETNHNVPESQFNIFSNIHSTSQPSLELSTPFEDFSTSNQNLNVNYPSQNQRGSPRPTQQLPFTTQVTFDSQKNVMANGEFMTPNTDASFQLHNSNSQQDSHYSQRLPSVKENSFNIHSANNPKQDQPYYYYQPSIIFNPYIRPTISTFAQQSDSSFGNIVSTKYPSPATAATIFSTMFPGRNMYNQNLNIPQSFLTQNSRLTATTKYPQPPSLGHIIPAPTSPTLQNGEKVFAQHTGITQASVSPFPSITPPKYNLNYNSQQTVSKDQNFSPNSQPTKIQGGTNDNPVNVNSQAQQISNLDTEVKPEIKPSQQYDGELYEYNKPTEALITPTESDESIQENDYSQFGQKLRPSPSQANTNLNQMEKQNEHSNNQRYPSSQDLQPLAGTGPLTESQNSEPQSGLQETSDLNTGGFNKDKQNRQPIGNAQPTSNSQFSTGAYNEAQTTADYNGPFGFSSRIRPCCQGSRRTSISQTPNRLAGNDLQSSPFGNQNSNLKSAPESGNLFSTQSSGLLKDLQNAQTTSQSLFSAKEDEFDGARKPPSFDEASGYHY